MYFESTHILSMSRAAPQQCSHGRGQDITTPDVELDAGFSQLAQGVLNMNNTSCTICEKPAHAGIRHEKELDPRITDNFFFPPHRETLRLYPREREGFHVSEHQEAYSMGKNQGKGGISDDKLFHINVLGLPKVCNADRGIREI